jgi:hypothetical protein
MELIHEMTYRAMLAPPVTIGAGAEGRLYPGLGVEYRVYRAA